MSRRCIRRRGARVSYVDASPGKVMEWDVVDRNPWPVRYPRYILSDGRLRRVASKKPDVSIDFP